MNDKVGFFEENLAMNGNIIRASHAHSVKKLVCVLSTCIPLARRPMAQGDGRGSMALPVVELGGLAEPMASRDAIAGGITLV